MMMWLSLPLRSPAFLSRPERAGKLRDCENSPASKFVYFFRAHPSQQAQIVLGRRFNLAPLPKFTNGAVGVQTQSGRCVRLLYLSNFLQNSPCLADSCTQFDPSGHTWSAVNRYSQGR